MEKVVLDPGCFLGLAAAAIETYNREASGFLIGIPRQGRGRKTTLKAAYPLQTAHRKPSSVAIGNFRAFDRARRTMRRIYGKLEHVGGFHSHTGGDGAPRLSPGDLRYITRQVAHLHRFEEGPWEGRWLEIIVAIKRRRYKRPQKREWSWRRYARKIGCTAKIRRHTGYVMTFAAYWVTVRSGQGGPRDTVTERPIEAELRIPWRGRKRKKR
jgi:proteasome lid subunit RPN8/RPN11